MAGQSRVPDLCYGVTIENAAEEETDGEQCRKDDTTVYEEPLLGSRGEYASVVEEEGHFDGQRQDNVLPPRNCLILKMGSS